MLDIQLEMQVMFLIWVALVVLTIRRTLASGSVGLPMALLLAMSFLYGGCFVYAVPGYTHLRADGLPALARYGFTEWDVVRGTFASLLGVLGFAIGAGAFQLRWRRSPKQVYTRSRVYERNIIKILAGIGIVGFAIHYSGLSFPMSYALNEAGRNVAVAAICLGAYLAHRDGKLTWKWIALAALVPIYYFAVFGFLSYGFLFGIILASFWIAQIHKKSATSTIKLALLSIATIYLILTAFVGWMTFRDEIRLIVWGGDSGSVWDTLLLAISKTELFSPWNFSALDQLNLRLDLPLFIGRMIEQHELNPSLQLFGESILIIPLVVLPRFMWPGKPTRGGSDFMETHTGIHLSDSATFGTGSTFEFYVNFGYVGVFLLFIVMGWIIRRLDLSAVRALQSGDLFRFARLFVVGVIAIDPLLRPFFIVNGAIFAWILMTGVKYGFAQYLQLRPIRMKPIGHRKLARKRS